MIERFTPQLGVAPMSIIVSVRESADTLLIAADRRFTGEGFKFLRPKLRQVPNQQIAWSSSGNSTIGLDEFGDWLELYDFTQKDWGVFSSDAIQKLNELNGEQRERTKLSRAVIKDEDITADVLIVGWLAGKIGVYELTRQGTLLNVLRYSFNAIGNGTTAALVARVAIKECGVNLDCLATLRIIMKSVTAHVDGCLAPIDIWRISKDSVEVCKENLRHEHIA